MRKWLQTFLVSIHSLLLEVRLLLYRLGFFKTIQIKVPVISVGNITMGGAGKTPFVSLLAKYLLQKGKRVGVVCRSYKAKVKKPSPVVLGRWNSASPFGDEACLLKLWNPELVVYTAESKSRAAQLLVDRENVDVIIVDDGFQHLALKRDLDLVLVDVSLPAEKYSLFPAGYLREGIHALRRAHAVVLTKVNRADSHTESMIASALPEEKIVGRLEYSLAAKVRKVGSQNVLDISEISDKRIFAFCGVAQPQAFFKMLVEEMKINPVATHAFSDHEKYSARSIKHLRRASETFEIDAFVTTEKDGVKLARWIDDFKIPFYSIEMEIKPIKDLSLLYEKVDKLFN